MSECIVSTEKEIWKPVVGHERWYCVSSLGRVRRRARGRGTWPGTIRKLHADRYGYPRVVLNVDRVRRAYSVHSLVAAAFIGPCPDGMEVDHIDRDRTNNRASNLRYVTHAVNLSKRCWS